MKQHKLKLPKWIFFVVIGWTLVIGMSSMTIAAVSGSLPEGLTASEPNKFTWNVSTSEISVTASPSSSSSCGGTSYTSQNETLTLTSGSQATLAISVISISGNGTVKLNDVTVSVGDSKTYELTANGTVSIYISSGGDSNESTKLKLNISYLKAGSDITLGFQPYEDVMYTANGTQINTVPQNITGNPGNGFQIVAADAHYILVGATLVDTSGTTSTIPAYDGKLFPTVSGTITPNFAYDEDADGIAPFLVGASTYWDYNSAKAAAGSSGTIILNDEYTLPAGDYTVPDGVTLLIPYNSSNTLCTTEPTITETNSTPSVYRMLTMASGANITVNGAISVSGQQYCSRPIGAISGQYGVIEMAYGSSITVEDGGNLYAWGYIAGVKGSDNSVSEGNIIIKSGGTVYEDFQVVDWRGGTATSSMINNGNKVFPMSQYYVQNVQVPMTFETGATEKTFTSVSVTLAGIQSAPITFIGNGGMFILGEDASVVKDYDETTDRLILTLEQGSITLGSVYMELKISTLGGKVVINSANYVLPLNNNITIIARSNTVLNAGNDIAMLPGSKMILEEGSNLNITSGSFYIYDLDEWTYDTASEAMTTKLNGNASNNGGYTSEFNYIMMAATYAHDRIKTRTTADLEDANVEINGVITVSEGAYVYTTAGGANVYSTGNGKIVFKGAVGTATKTYQAVATGSKRTGVAYCDIPITAAKLKNGDGNYVETSSATSVTAYTYCPACLEWEYDGTGSVNHATNVELGNSLNMYFAFWDPDNPNKDWQNHYVMITHKDADGKTVKVTKLYYDKNQWFSDTVNGHFACVVYYKELSAKQMGDIITVELYVTGEDVPIDTWSNSIQHYAMRMLKKYEADENKGTLRTLLVDMLNYGAECQKHFAEQAGTQITDKDLVNAGLSEKQREWATDNITITDKSTKTNTDNGYRNTSNLVLAGNIQYVVAFNHWDQIAKIEYSFANHWYDGDNDLPAGDAVKRDESYYGSGTFSIRYLVVADARQMITITVYDRDDNELGSWEDSIESYCARMINSEGATATQKAVCTAFMKFADSAEAYLEGGNRV